MTTLMRPCNQGGLVFPVFYKYFLATQLVTVMWWLNPDLYNTSILLEAVVVNFLEALKFLYLEALGSLCFDPFYAHHHPSLGG